MKILIFYMLLSIVAQTAVAEVVLDGSLGKSGSLAGPNYAIDAALGTQVGGNLFHSFQSFNLSRDETATFSGDANIFNVIGRVTGGNPSQIDGTLRSTIPNADLYLINPAGLLFGATAKLDVLGSFHASTATVLQLNDGGKLYAHIAPDSVLTSAPPSAFGFLNNSVAELQLDGAQLKVSAGKDMSFTAGKITLQANIAAKQLAALDTVGGRVRLASVANGEIKLGAGFNFVGQGGELTVRSSRLNNTGDKSGNIDIRAGHFVLDNSAIATLTASQDGGTLDIQANQVEITGGSRISSSSLKTGNSGNISIQATESITLSGHDSQGAGVAISANARGTDAQAGNAGNITLKTAKLALRDGAKLGSTSLGAGNGGTIVLDATDSVVLDGEDNQTTSSIYLVATGSGQGGSLQVKTNQLQLLNGASVAADTKGSGNGGNVLIQANTVQLSGIGKSHGSNILSNTQGTAENAGTGGTVEIQAKQLDIRDGGQISSSTVGMGAGGTINIQAIEKLTLSGKLDKYPSGIYSIARGIGGAGLIGINAGELTVQDDAQINAGTYGQGLGGNILLRAQRLSLFNQGKITALSQGTGDAGQIALQLADRLDMVNSAIETKTNQSDGGNIFISSPKYLYLRNSSITTSVEAQNGNGGNITLQPNFVVLDTSPIIARAIGGNGGNINITTKGIYRFALPDQSPIDASSQFGLDGVVTVASPEGETDEGLLVLPTNFNGAQALLKNLCTLEHFENLSTFIVKPANYPRAPEDYRPSLRVN